MKTLRIAIISIVLFAAGFSVYAFDGDTVKIKPVKKIQLDKKVVDVKKVTTVGNDSKPQGGCCACPLKFVQLWTTDDIEQELIIPASTYLACGQGYLACIQRPEDRIFLLDLHVQVWHEDFNSPGVWSQMTVIMKGCSGLPGGCEINIQIDTNTGNLKITTYNSSGNYRIVILG